MFRSLRALPSARQAVRASARSVRCACGRSMPYPRRLALARRLWQLTPKQLEVLALVVRGLSISEVAEELGTANNTVQIHVGHLLRKSGAATRARLIAAFWSELR